MKKSVLTFIFAFAAVLVAVSVFLVMVSDAGSQSSDRATLSVLSTEEQLDFLQTQGIEVPNGYSEYITSLIAHVEEDPDYPIAVSNPVLYETAVQVRDAVNGYYQRDSDPLYDPQ